MESVSRLKLAYIKVLLWAPYWLLWLWRPFTNTNRIYIARLYKLSRGANKCQNARWNRWVFFKDFKSDGVSGKLVGLLLSSYEFQAAGPAWLKLRSPNLVWIRRLMWSAVSADLRPGSKTGPSWRDINDHQPLNNGPRSGQGRSDMLSTMTRGRTLTVKAEEAVKVQDEPRSVRSCLGRNLSYCWKCCIAESSSQSMCSW